MYGNMSDMTYLIVTVAYKGLDDLSVGLYSNDEIRHYIRLFVELDNLLVNAISRAAGETEEMLYQSFFNSTPFLMKNTTDSASIDMEKFSKMMVQMKEKVYIGDV